MKIIFSILAFLLCSFSAFAQQQCPQIIFNYDASGNRWQRKLIITDCSEERISHTDNTNVLTSTMHVNVYPNPAQDKINIEMEKDGSETENTILLYDVNGKEIYSAVTASLQIQVDVSALSVGTYLLKITRGKDYKTYNVSKN